MSMIWYCIVDEKRLENRFLSTHFGSGQSGLLISMGDSELNWSSAIASAISLAMASNIFIHILPIRLHCFLIVLILFRSSGLSIILASSFYLNSPGRTDTRNSLRKIMWGAHHSMLSVLPCRRGMKRSKRCKGWQGWQSDGEDSGVGSSSAASSAGSKKLLFSLSSAVLDRSKMS